MGHRVEYRSVIRGGAHGAGFTMMVQERRAWRNLVVPIIGVQWRGLSVAPVPLANQVHTLMSGPGQPTDKRKVCDASLLDSSPLLLLLICVPLPSRGTECIL